jgi:CRP-like cAMP-binding protein
MTVEDRTITGGIGVLIHPFNTTRPQTCIACPSAALEVCTKHAAEITHGAIPQTELTIPRRRIICRAQDLIDTVLFVCEGWAASLVTLSNGDRQILTFLLPGDVVSSALLFRPNPGCLVETITEVTCRSYDRAEYLRRTVTDHDAFGALSNLWLGEKESADRLAIDLGRRTAEERIARLILSLMDRLAARGMTQGATMEFPLRQHHVADATGLTPVHVSKLLTDLRRRGLIRINDRSLEVLDDGALRRIAGIR